MGVACGGSQRSPSALVRTKGAVEGIDTTHDRSSIARHGDCVHCTRDIRGPVIVAQPASASTSVATHATLRPPPNYVRHTRIVGRIVRPQVCEPSPPTLPAPFANSLAYLAESTTNEAQVVDESTRPSRSARTSRASPTGHRRRTPQGTRWSSIPTAEVTDQNWQFALPPTPVPIDSDDPQRTVYRYGGRPSSLTSKGTASR